MRSLYKHYGWIVTTILGSALFALGFDLFLLPHDLNAGGVAGLAMVIHKLLPFASVGIIQIIINLPLFLLAQS